MSAGLRFPRLWSALGLFLIGAVVGGSLVKLDPQLPLEGGDKLHHLIAYGTLMYWWGMLQPGRRLPWAIFFVVLGAALEFAQSLVPGRFMEWQDAVANLAGIALALAALATPASGLLARLDQRLFDRLDARAP